LNLSNQAFWLDVTLCCGQVFRWEKIGEWWYGVVGDDVLKVRQEGNKLEYENTDARFVNQYFGLNENLEEIAESIRKDTHINKAIQEYWGLRIIKQDPWECLISYICATFKNIAAIKHMLNNLSRKFGTKKTLDDFEFYSFPKPETLARTNEKDLASCGLGYRAKYVLETSKRIYKDNFDFATLTKIPYSEAKKILTEFSGVGAKVADCILLFSLEKTEAFPVDIWVKRVMLNHYRDKLPPRLVEKLDTSNSLGTREYEELNSFGRSYFGKYAGYAQEYLYHFERMKI
jgi:N-glycosylase/DNA lyase